MHTKLKLLSKKQCFSITFLGLWRKAEGGGGRGVNGFSKYFRNVMALKTVATAAKVSLSTESGLYHFSDKMA